MNNFQDKANFIWQVADDILRGAFKQHEYGEVELNFNNYIHGYSPNVQEILESFHIDRITGKHSTDYAQFAWIEMNNKVGKPTMKKTIRIINQPGV